MSVLTNSESVCNAEVVDLGASDFADANRAVRAALENCDTVKLDNVGGQRYLGCAMESGKRLEIYGTPGNDMACYMDGGSIEVFGNAQDQIGNTMNAGEIVVHGRCGDAAGYGMRGGSIFIKDDCGWRVGIHMKQFQDKCPTIVIGGNAGSFLGEYMAGGIILLLGEPGEYLATGMHGGVIYLKYKLEPSQILEGLVLEEADHEDKEQISKLLKEYVEHFGDQLSRPIDTSGDEFYKLKPQSSRPYESMYVS